MQNAFKRSELEKNTMNIFLNKLAGWVEKSIIPTSDPNITIPSQCWSCPRFSDNEEVEEFSFAWRKGKRVYQESIAQNTKGRRKDGPQKELGISERDIVQEDEWIQDSLIS